MSFFASLCSVDDIEEQLEPLPSGDKKVGVPKRRWTRTDADALKLAIAARMDTRVQSRYFVGDFAEEFLSKKNSRLLHQEYHKIVRAAIQLRPDSWAHWKKLLEMYERDLGKRVMSEWAYDAPGEQGTLVKTGEKRRPIWCNITAAIALKHIRRVIKKFDKDCNVDVVELPMEKLGQNHFIVAVKPRSSKPFSSRNFIVDMWGALEQRWDGGMDRSVVWSATDFKETYGTRITNQYEMVCRKDGKLERVKRKGRDPNAPRERLDRADIQFRLKQTGNLEKMLNKVNF